MSINNRSFQRFQSPPGKWVMLQTETTQPSIFQLIDLSQAGMSFISLEENEFKRGMKIIITRFKHKTLQNPLVGIVRYVQINTQIEDKYTDYKVGVEFMKT